MSQPFTSSSSSSPSSRVFGSEVYDGVEQDQLDQQEQGNVRKTKGDLQVTSLNVRGLSDQKKVRHLVNTCNKRCKFAKDNIFM